MVMIEYRLGFMMVTKIIYTMSVLGLVLSSLTLNAGKIPQCEERGGTQERSHPGLQKKIKKKTKFRDTEEKKESAKNVRPGTPHPSPQKKRLNGQTESQELLFAPDKLNLCETPPLLRIPRRKPSNQKNNFMFHDDTPMPLPVDARNVLRTEKQLSQDVFNTLNFKNSKENSSENQSLQEVEELIKNIQLNDSMDEINEM
ncbi:hypothetical protein Bealeia1_00773 [Candidatus Bealeia paramacronuclearis]|uniref:Uncharacterized protein n=1 Tax=Candidatus Bealeia paramacronuclearis TaxID=1921001 RepID=A0ABZ2C2A6_9PROT|nr:hypothetical protein [Candidatus Bealeia paramacronuclearis]